MNAFLLGGESPTVAEVREAWAYPPLRDGVIDALARNVSKHGSFCRSGWLDTLPEALDRGQAVELYCRIRDECHRSELEWREEFEYYFPRAAGRLAEVDRDHYLFECGIWLVRAFRSSPGEPGVIRLLRAARRLGLDVGALRVEVAGGEPTGAVGLESVLREALPASAELVTVAEFARRIGYLQAAGLAAGM